MGYKRKYLLKYNFIDFDNVVIKRYLKEINHRFSSLLKLKRPDLLELCPYVINVKNLIEKNRWTTGIWIAVNKENNELDLHLNVDKLTGAEVREFPFDRLVQLIFHEFRHKIQRNSPMLQSLINHTNWQKFKEFMQSEYNKDEDMINHIFHEVDPAEIDAHIFAIEMTGMKFQGTIFDITDESLGLLKNTQSEH